jgi:hypothetical protein
VPRFETQITDLPPSLGFDLPFDLKATFGKVRAPVRVTTAGDRVTVDVALDTEPRTAQVPAAR